MNANYLDAIAARLLSTEEILEAAGMDRYEAAVHLLKTSRPAREYAHKTYNLRLDRGYLYWGQARPFEPTVTIYPADVHTFGGDAAGWPVDDIIKSFADALIHHPTDQQTA